MFKTKIIAVDGETATDIQGNKYKIISNITIFPGSTVFTDGKVIYGWEWNHSGRPFMLSKKQVSCLPLFYYANQSKNAWAMVPLAQPWTLPSKFDYGFINLNWSTFEYWYSRPYQFNAGNKPYAFRGTYSDPLMYDSKGNIINAPDEWDISKRIFLLYDKNAGFVWQKGSICQRFGTYGRSQYNYTAYNVEWIVTDSPPYLVRKRTYYTGTYNWRYNGITQVGSMQCAVSGNSDLTDLQIIYGVDSTHEHSISLYPILQQILNDARSYLNTKQTQAVTAAGKSVSDAYPVSLPTPVIHGFWLGNNISAVGDIIHGEHFTYPIDADAGQGGNPLVDADSIAYNATGEHLSPTYASDCRVIHDFRMLDADTIEFYVNLRGLYTCYGYHGMVIDPDESDIIYEPAATANSWQWEFGYLDDSGNFVDSYTSSTISGQMDFWYKITIINGAASFQKVKTNWNFYQNDKTFGKYHWLQTAVNVGYITNNDTQSRISGNWTWVKEIIPLSNNGILVFGSMNFAAEGENDDIAPAVAHYQNDSLVSAERLEAQYYNSAGLRSFVGLPVNPNYSIVADMDLFKKQYEKLINDPYYDLDYDLDS